MTKEELAAMLDGIQYCDGISEEAIRMASESGLLIVFGHSDDLCEFRGAISDEFGCYDGGIITHKALKKPINAVWCPNGKECSWAYETDLPSAEFNIYDEEELYCIGIVIDLNDVSIANEQEEKHEVKHGEWIHDEFDMLCCSECKEELAFEETTPYCPYCGAKMCGDDEK